MSFKLIEDSRSVIAYTQSVDKQESEPELSSESRSEAVSARSDIGSDWTRSSESAELSLSPPQQAGDSLTPKWYYNMPEEFRKAYPLTRGGGWRPPPRINAPPRPPELTPPWYDSMPESFKQNNPLAEGGGIAESGRDDSPHFTDDSLKALSTLSASSGDPLQLSALYSYNNDKGYDFLIRFDSNDPRVRIRGNVDAVSPHSSVGSQWTQRSYGSDEVSPSETVDNEDEDKDVDTEPDNDQMLSRSPAESDTESDTENESKDQ